MPDESAANEPKRAAAPLPPVTSQPGAASGMSGGRDGRMAPPFPGKPAVAAAALVEEETADEEGTAEPMFEADVFETEAVLAELSHAAHPAEEFPLDAFIIPEQTDRLPNGVERKPLAEASIHTPVSELADRLEKLSHRLRVEDADAVIARLATGDRLDALLAGLLAGYLAGSK
ncbi:MAG: hypothetical protein ACT443_14900 [Gemmatimonadota bacterium]